MDERSGSEERPAENGDQQRRAWDEARGRYLCADGVTLGPAKKAKGSVIAYEKDKESGRLAVRLSVSGTRLNRDAREILGCTEDTKTVTFPRTVRIVKQKTFYKQK